jgi:hypothetical protein
LTRQRATRGERGTNLSPRPSTRPARAAGPADRG